MPTTNLDHSTGKEIKILALVIGGSRKHASTRYRIIQYMPYLQENNFQVDLLPLKNKRGGPKKILDSMAEEKDIINKATKCDIILIQKRLFRCGFIRKLSKLNKPIVFDFDDSLVSGGNYSLFTRTKLNLRFKTICKHASLVFAGSHHLAGLAKIHCKNTVVLPTTVDIEKYHTKTDIDNGKSLVWIGQARENGFPQIQEIMPALKELSCLYPGMTLTMITNGQIIENGVNINCIEWSEDNEAELLASADIGISPILDDEYSKGGCCLKAIQYMAAGLPVVCSKRGAHLEIIQDNNQGLLANSHQDWVTMISQLIDNDTLKKRLGQNARTRVEQAYSLQTTRNTLLKNLRRLITKK